MSTLRTALRVELTKVIASPVLRITTVLVVLGIAALAASLVGAVQGGNEQITAKLGALASERGWSLLLGVVAQITAAGALLAFGVALAWAFGREFADGTVGGLFGLPVSRPTIALAKLLVHLVWVIAVAVLLTGLLLLAGLLLRLGPVDGVVLGQLGRQWILTVLTGGVTVPAGWAATLGRGVLPGIAVTLGILVGAQVTAIAAPAAAAWVPFAAPALWAVHPGFVRGGHLAVVGLLVIGFGVLTTTAWKRLQVDR